MPIVEHYTFLGHIGLVAKLGSFIPTLALYPLRSPLCPLSPPPPSAPFPVYHFRLSALEAIAKGGAVVACDRNQAVVYDP